MGRRRERPPTNRPDRISAHELSHWMKVNGISGNQLALALSIKYSTVQGWLRGYTTTPAWLEHRINIAAHPAAPKLPRWGERWPVETSPDVPLPDLWGAFEPAPDQLEDD